MRQPLSTRFARQRIGLASPVHIYGLDIVSIDIYMYWTSVFNQRQCCILWDFSAALRSSTNPSIYRATKSFKYNFSFPSMYRRLKSMLLIQCYERKQIWSETGSQMASEIPSKLTCVLAVPSSHRRLNWTAMLRVQSNINVYDCKRALTWSTIL